MERDGGRERERHRGKQEWTENVNLLIITCCSKILEECIDGYHGSSGRVSETDWHHYEENEEVIHAKLIHPPQCEKKRVAERVHITYIRSLNTDTQTAPLRPFWIPATITGTEPQTWLDFRLTVHMSSSSPFGVTSESVEIELGREAH